MPAFTRRRLLQTCAAIALCVTIPGSAAADDRTLTPEMFGAKGDGRTDDSAAFAALSARLNAQGGGTIDLRKTTYLVGTAPPTGAGRRGVTILAISGCRSAVTLRGNGARLRCAGGQRYGSFAPGGSGGKQQGAQAQIVTPYHEMILVENCTGPVEISDVELDGNVGALIIGGKYGDKGWQIPAYGVTLRNNPGGEILRNIYAHDHAHDGFYVDGVDHDTPGVNRQLIGLRADNNGRQGMSVVGGRGYQFQDCRFTRTGRGPTSSAPAAGVDIEPERGKKVRNLSFVNCSFEDNKGSGLLASTGDSADVHFSNCTFVGTTNWAAWPNKPGFRFDGCTFAGAIVNAFGNADPAQATQFVDCLFTDDPKYARTGKIELRNNLIANLPHSDNVLFDRCKFLLDHGGVLPWSVGPIYRDCTMRQSAHKVANTRGTFEGTTTITGPVNLGKSSMIKGQVILNGKPVSRS